MLLSKDVPFAPPAYVVGMVTHDPSSKNTGSEKVTEYTY